jgi:hypothetical protein
MALVLPVALAAALPAGEGGGARFVRGNANGDLGLDVSDGVSIFNFLFAGGDAPPCRDAADADDDGRIIITDGIFVLNFLFLGGERPPPPSPGAPCPGADPTPDLLDCAGGEDGGPEPPEPPEPPGLVFYPAQANAPGVGARSRRPLPLDSGEYRIEAGHSFVLLVRAQSSPVTRAGFTLAAPGAPLEGNPAALRVTADGPLGDPAQGGAAPGTNLAPWFFREVDPWSDPIYLVEEAGLRVAGGGPLAPGPGLYRFTAQVIDDACAPSPERSFALRVVPSRAPEVFAWIEGGPEPAGAPAPHDPASGNARVEAESSGFLLVVEGFAQEEATVPRAAVAAPPGPVPAALRVTAVPPFSGPEGPRGDLGALFARDPAAPARFFLRAEPTGLFPALGDTALALELDLGAALAEDVGRATFTLEVRVSFPRDIRPIFNQSCGGCHEEPDPFEGLELVAPGEPALHVWRNVVNVYAAEPEIDSSAPFVVRPLFPEESYLWHKLAGTHLDPAVGGEGVRMPLDAPDGLPGEMLHRVRSWIAEGAGVD